MEKLIQNFLDYLSVERGFSPRTIEAYRHDLNKFMEFFESIGKNGILSITKEDVRRFLSIQAQTNGAVTRARKLSAIKSLFNYLDHEGIISANPVSGIEAPKLPEKEPTYLTQSEYQNLIATVKREATPFTFRAI